VSVDWAAVYRTTFSDLVRYLYRKVWDAERAQDLAQEAFARVLAQQRRGMEDEVENPRGLVFTVAANLARDEARTVIRRKKHLALLKSDAEATATGDADPVDRMQRDAERQLAQDALNRLSERDREVLLLWDAGMSYEEIAAQTGLAQGAIGTTLSRARRRLVAAYESMEAQHAAR
jgi:RNA polymerase sigma-70 factor (ECF subfamily)